jgi:predicted metal-dependent hydrolase
MGIILPDTITITNINASVPVKITSERRRSLRASVGATGLLLRIPNSFNKAQFDNAWLWFTRWVHQLVETKPTILQHLIPRRYKNGDFIVVRGLIYKIVIITQPLKISKASILPNQVIQLKIGDNYDVEHSSAIVRKLIASLMSKVHLAPLAERVAELNKQHFNVKVVDIKIPHTHSRWGSCSTTGTIRLSSRLLLAPLDVIDYVIIHELSHLIEFNHSNKFWKLVEKAMPNYQEKEKWLKENNYVCRF